MSSVWIKINQIRKNKFVRLGIPFFVLVLGGSFYLEQFSKLRYINFKPIFIFCYFTPSDFEMNYVSY